MATVEHCLHPEYAGEDEVRLKENAHLLLTEIEYFPPSRESQRFKLRQKVSSGEKDSVHED